MNNYVNHPDADAWPMFPEDELKALAQDIKANGQRHPIIVSKGRIVDGRNRLAACTLAEVEPIYEEFGSTDEKAIKAFILSENERRRHMTKGARAASVALMYPDSQQGKKDTSPKNGEVKAEYLRQARTVLRHSRELAEMVAMGAVTLAEAYEKARKALHETSTSDERLRKLDTRYPDLSAKVREGELTLPGAEAEARERDDQNKQRIAGFNDSLKTMSNSLQRFSGKATRERLARFINEESEQIKDIDPLKLIDVSIAELQKLKELIRG